MSQDPIWSDDALHTSNIPGREQFAVALAARIDQTPLEHNSTVFGLVGAWGTGKTTLLSEIRTHLQAADWQIVDFSPWSGKSSADPSAPSSTALLETLSGDNTMSLNADARRQLKSSCGWCRWSSS